METSEEFVVGIPFVSHVNQSDRPTIGEPREFLKRAYVRFYTNNDNLLRTGKYLLMGYSYDFKPYLRKFLYNQYGGWHEVYAPNKTTLRQIVGGKIHKIVELK